MMRSVVVAVFLLLAVGCVTPTPYQRTTFEWTRRQNLQNGYQEVMTVAAVYKSPAWYQAYAIRDIELRQLGGASREARLAQANAEAAGDYEIVLLFTTWDRRENDLDRGQRSVWRVRLLDDEGNEITPLEIKKDKRPRLVVRAEFPAMGDFANAYVVKFKKDPAKPLKLLRLRISSERGGVDVEWLPR